MNSTGNRHQECVRLAEVFSDRLAEMLANEDYEVKVKGTAVSIFGVGELRGESFGVAFGPIWFSRMSTTQKLEAVFDMISRGLQKFLTNTLHRPWPSEHAKSLSENSCTRLACT